MKIIGLDVGTKRIGVAKVDTGTRIAIPDGIIAVDNGQEFTELARLARLYDTHYFVLGLPRSNSGNETAQSAYTRDFAKVLKQVIPEAEIRFQDETFTSVEAEERLKTRKRNYQRAEIDAEAAAIILQDFVEGQQTFTAGTPSTQTPASAQTVQTPPKAPAPSPAPTAAAQNPQKSEQPMKTKKPKKKLKTYQKVLISLLTILVSCGIIVLLASIWYLNALTPVSAADCSADTAVELEDCQIIDFTVEQGDGVAEISRALEESGLIKNAFAFRLHVRLNGQESSLKAGVYPLQKSMSVESIVATFIAGEGQSNVFTFTVLPGETIMDIKANLAALGYEQDEIADAFAKTYSYSMLKNKPEGVSLEGYLYGDTFEFYKGEKVENILRASLSSMQKLIDEQNLEAEFKKQDLSLHEGLTLASIVQKEASAKDYPTVAQVFLTRLRQGMALGSDVTATYALDLIDPDRETYSDNAAALSVDSPYNTRKYSGLPPGPISSPSKAALDAVAHPASTSYLYFLTGDDGKMYYSYTESEHQQNAAKYCQELCNVSL